MCVQNGTGNLTKCDEHTHETRGRVFLLVLRFLLFVLGILSVFLRLVARLHRPLVLLVQFLRCTFHYLPPRTVSKLSFRSRRVAKGKAFQERTHASRYRLLPRRASLFKRFYTSVAGEASFAPMSHFTNWPRYRSRETGISVNVSREIRGTIHALCHSEAVWRFALPKLCLKA